jgi:lipoprotein-anchoring transpeptidase ErfK/SrfK
MNPPGLSSQKRFFSLWLTLTLVFGLTGAFVWFVGSTSVFSSIQNWNSSSLPTNAPFQGYVMIPKAAYTPTPTPTPIPTAIPTAIPEQIIEETGVDTSITVALASGVDSTTEDTEIPEYTGNKHILVDISDQYMYVYEGDALVFDFVASTGMNNSTSTGSFKVLNKIPSAYGSTWDIRMPNWLGIYWSAGLQNGIHALPILPNGAQLWEGYLGTPISYGCIVLGTYESQLLYDWAEIGTPVEIQW